MNPEVYVFEEWPPLRLWEEYPNWTDSWEDESHFAGEAWRPAKVQDYISNDVDATVGHLKLADGSCLPALLRVFEGQVDFIYGFVTEEEPWAIRFGQAGPRWRSLADDASEQSVSLSDPRVFPLTVTSHLPHRPGGEAIRFVVQPNGTSPELSPWKPTFGRRLYRYWQLGITGKTEMIDTFINLVDLEYLASEVQSLPAEAQRQLEEHVESLPIDSPYWRSKLYVHRTLLIPGKSPEEMQAIRAGISDKNRLTAEALRDYFRSRRSSQS